MASKILNLLESIVMLFFVVLCGIDVVPMNGLGWIILCVYAILHFSSSVFDLKKG